jgi:hypothetical protein
MNLLTGEIARPVVGARPIAAQPIDWMRCAAWFVALAICVGFWVGVAFGLSALF